MGYELPTDEHDTLGGLVLEAAGRVPTEGETFTWRDLVFTVEAVSGPRLEKVRIVLPPRRPTWPVGEAASDD